MLDKAWDSGFILASATVLAVFAAFFMLGALKKAPKSEYDRKRANERLLKELDRHNDRKQ